MLTGTEFGKALAVAIERKKVAKNDLAAQFDVKPPSVQGWLKTGRIRREKLEQIWLYFSDVVGPEHWGIAAFPWNAKGVEPVQLGDWGSVRTDLYTGGGAIGGMPARQAGRPLSDRATSLGLRLDKLPKPRFERAYALLDLTLRTLEAEVKTKPRSPKA